MWKYKLKRLHTISSKLDYKTTFTKKWWKLQAVHLPAKMWKLHPGLKTKIEFRAIGHWGQKHSASCLLHFLLATLLLATWPMPQAQLFQLNDLMQRYSTQHAVYFDTTIHELQKSSLAVVSHFQFPDFWWQGPLSRHQSSFEVGFGSPQRFLWELYNKTK